MRWRRGVAPHRGDERCHSLHTEYLGLAVDQLRKGRPRGGRRGDGFPARSSAVNYYGSITVDYERELAQLDEKGHRPLRAGAADEPASGL